jgi:beta-lactamase class A
MKIPSKTIVTSICLIVGSSCYAQVALLKAKIDSIGREAKGTVGFAMLGIENRDTLSIRGRNHLPMQSVMKLPIAITVLHYIDEGRLSLDQLIHIDKSDLPETYSPLRDKFPDGNVDVSIKVLLSYMISLSDNDACDILLKTLGGPEVVDTYMHSFGIKGVAIKASEFEMAKSWGVQFTNWCEPKEMVRLLDIAMKPNFLSKPNQDYLWKVMTATSTGPKQIKGLLPAGTVMAHKTGRSGTNDQGITAATNDVGIITLPNGKHLALAIFITNSTVDLITRESVIARIAEAAYNYEMGF